MTRQSTLIATVMVAAAALGGVVVSRTATRAEASATVPLIAPQKAAALVAATTGDAANQVKAVGDQARLINASLPFDGAPVTAARPFAVALSDAVDHRRALLCLTQAVYYEAGFEPSTGRRAVAQVVLNRLRHPAFPKSVCGVVYQSSSGGVCQFSFVCDGALYRRPAAAAWKQAADIAAAALAGYVERSVGQATHYHADYVAPRWAPLLSKVAQFGAHIFYRWPGAWGEAAAFTGRYIGEPDDPSSLRPALRPAVIAAIESGIGAPAMVADSGPPIARAPNDVGGLLDPSKGWTLNIPLPSDGASASQAITAQQTAGKPVAAAEPAVAMAGALPTILAAR